MDCCKTDNTPTRRRNWWPWIIFLALAVVSVVALLSDAKAASAARALQPPVNSTCPVTVGEPIDPAILVEYQGREVYLCCARCRRKFNENPDAYVTNLHADYFATADSTTSDSLSTHHVSSADETHHACEGDHDGHDHAEPATTTERLIAWIGKFHPPTTHFPVALLILAATLEAWLMVVKRGATLLRPAITVMATFGSLIAVGVAVLGWFNGGFRLTDPETLMSFHRWFGTATGLWALVLLPWTIGQWKTTRSATATPSCIYRTLLLGGAAMVSITGFLGGALVFGLDHLAW